MATKSVHVRVDEKLKKRLEHVFGQMGFDLPTAVRIFFQKVDLTGNIPFTIGVNNDIDYYTPQQIAELDRLAADAKKGINVSGPFNSVKDMWKDIMKNES